MAGSTLGFKHSSSTLEKFKARGLSEKNLKHLAKINSDPDYIAKRLDQLKKLHLDLEVQAKVKNHLKAYHKSEEGKNLLIRNNLARSNKVEVIDIESGEKVIYISQSEVARALGVHRVAISRYLRGQMTKPYGGRYKMQILQCGS